MDLRTAGFIYILCLIRDGVSFTGRTVNITEFTCGQTFNIDRNEKLLVSFYNQKFENKDRYGFKSSRCILTVVSKNPNLSICIKNHDKGHDKWVYLSTCLATFKYFIGYLPFHMLHGYTCSNFEPPLCTDRSTVYPTFNDGFKYGRYPVIVEIYAQNKNVTTTPYLYSNDDDDDNNGDNDNTTGIIVKAAIGSMVLAVLLYIGQAYMKYKCRGDTAVPNSDEQRTDESVPQSDDQAQGRLMCATNAPQYGEGTEQGPTTVEDKQWEIEDPQPDSAYHVPQNQPSSQLIPTAPPPDYADVPPPPYPGY